VRKLASMAGVSNPYLSQIERGLRRPSADILNGIAKALRISAETLYVQAGILDERERDDGDLVSAILADRTITERQKQVLVQIYSSFRGETDRRRQERGRRTRAPATPAAASVALDSTDGGAEKVG
jgi:transcriptional regulator with XRE-family HTH domain